MGGEQMLDLKIDRLILTIANGAGHEHRVRPVVERAVALFAEGSLKLLEREAVRQDVFESLGGGSMELNLNSTSNEQAARAIADGWLQAMALKLRS
jgi:hypothetical protein